MGWRYLKKWEVILIIFLMLSMIFVTLYNFWFINIPEWFTGSSRLGLLLNQMCLAFISSFIFYLVVVVLKRSKDKANIYEYVAEITQRIVGGTIASFNRLVKGADLRQVTWPPTQNMIEQICNKINPQKPSPLQIISLRRVTYATWMQYFNQWISETKESISKILLHIPFLDSELIKIMGRIEKCNFFEKYESVVLADLKMIRFSFIEKELYEYVILINNLKIYAEKNLDKYRLKNSGDGG